MIFLVFIAKEHDRKPENFLSAPEQKPPAVRQTDTRKQERLRLANHAS